MQLYRYSVFIVFAMLWGCSVQTPVRVLPQGSSTCTVSVGGPWVPGTSPAGVIPYTIIGYQYGVTKELTVSSNFHALMAIFKTPGIDCGISWQALREQNNIPEITITPRLFYFQSFRSPMYARVFPTVAITASRRIASADLLYCGTEFWFQTTTAQHLITPYLGYQTPLSSKLSLQTELKWMAMNMETSHGVFEGEGAIKGYGNIGGFIGVNYAL